MEHTLQQVNQQLITFQNRTNAMNDNMLIMQKKQRMMEQLMKQSFQVGSCLYIWHASQ